jgi:FKBP-type peptidyl-prolyl cis-trans isomerase
VIPEEMLRIQKFFSAVLPFKPRLFQLRMLTAIRNGQSVVATAPTSYGKSFGGLYAAAWALTANATAEAAMGPDAPHSVVAIIVPTQSLCDQTLADCYARMQKLQNTVVKSGETIVGFRTKLYNQDVDVCRMLVATPHHFEELLLQGWPGRGRVLKCVVIDEFHEIANPHARILTLIDCPYVLLSATMNNPVEVTEQLELLEKEKMKRGLIGERMRQPIVLEEDNGDEDAMVDEIVGDAHSIGRQVILVPPDGRMLYRPIDLVWFRADPPPLELSVVAKPRKRFEEVKEDRSTFIPMNRVCAKDGEEIVRQQLPAPEALSLWELLNPDTAVAGPPAFTSLFPDKGEVRNWIDTVKTQFTDSSAAVKSSVLGRLAPQPASERAAASVAIAEAVTGTVDLTESNDGGVMKTIIVQGTGIKALKGSTVFVHYTGSLIGGEVFDTSRDYEHAKPMKIVVGAGVVVAGMDLAVESMCVGEQAKFFFRADYAYGDEGSAGKSGMQVDIPANADIEFVVELMSVGESEDLGEARAGAPTGDPALDGITSLLIQATLQGMTPVIVFNPDVDKLMQLVERVANEFDEAERLLKETKEWQDKEANREEGLARALRILKGGNDTSPEYRDALETCVRVYRALLLFSSFLFCSVLSFTVPPAHAMRKTYGLTEDVNRGGVETCPFVGVIQIDDTHLGEPSIAFSLSLSLARSLSLALTRPALTFFSHTPVGTVS